MYLLLGEVPKELETFLQMSDRALDENCPFWLHELDEVVVRIISEREFEFFAPDFDPERDIDPSDLTDDTPEFFSVTWIATAIWKCVQLARLKHEDTRFALGEEVHEVELEEEAKGIFGERRWRGLPGDAMGLLIQCLWGRRQLALMPRPERVLFDSCLAYEISVKARIRSLFHQAHVAYQDANREALDDIAKKLKSPRITLGGVRQIVDELSRHEAISELVRNELRQHLKQMEKVKELRDVLAHSGSREPAILGAEKVRAKLNEWLNGTEGIFSAFPSD